MLFSSKEGEKNVAPVYRRVADRIGRTEVACRIMLHHVKQNVNRGAILLEDALAAKRLPLQASKKVRELAAERAAVSQKRGPSTKKALPVPASKARKQAAIEKKACSPRDAVADEPLPGQASRSQGQPPAERKASSLGMAPFVEPPFAPAFKLQELTPTEKFSRFRSREEGARVDPFHALPLPGTKEELNAVIALAGMKLQQLQEQGPDRSTSSRHDTPLVGDPLHVVGSSWGQMKVVGPMRVVDPGTSSTETIEDLSISSTEKFHEYYVEDEA